MTNNSPFSIVAVNDTVEVLDAESADTQRGHFAVGRVLGPSDYISPENAAALYLDTLGSDASICTVRSKLNQVARWFNYADYQHCDWHLMRYDNVVKFIAHLKESGIQTVTINAYLCAVKGVAQTAWNLGQVSDHDLMRIKAIKQLRGSRKPVGKALTRQESKAMLSKCEGATPQFTRDRAILLLLLGCGLRRAEITRIELKNVYLEEGRIRLVGKGNKERDVFLNDAVLAAVNLNF